MSTIVVDHGRELRDAARRQRRLFGGRLIAVAGGSLCSTARRMIDAVLEIESDGGLYAELANLNPQDRFAVAEIDGEDAADAARLAEWLAPDFLVLLDAAGDTAWRRELLASIPREGAALVHGDSSALVREAIAASRAPVMTFGRTAACDWSAVNVQMRDGELILQIDGERLAVRAWGRQCLPAVAATVAIARLAGISWETIRRRLAAFEPVPQQWPLRRLGPAHLIEQLDDRRTALELLAETPTHGERVVVWDAEPFAGDAREDARQWGRSFVTVAAADRVVACGSRAADVAVAAIDAGMPGDRVASFATVDAALPELRSAVRDGNVILLQGPRATALRRLAALLEGERAAEPSPCKGARVERVTN